jgi:hypothetical protein
MAIYGRASPWYNTPEVDGVMDLWEPRYIEAHADDKVYQIDSYYNLRPDLLAWDLYENPKLWWVFTQRNPTVIRDPIFDFYTGQIIMVTSPDQIRKVLGL